VNKKRFIDTDDDGSSEDEGEKIDYEDEETKIDLKYTINEGSFLPVITVLNQ